MVPALITNLIPDPQRPEEEKLIIGQMPSQFPPMINHMAKCNNPKFWKLKLNAI
jgi:hypothetical protein